MTTAVPAGRTPPQAAVVRRRLVVRGIVQGVGFRPFVWGMATRHGLTGSVCNTSGAVVIEAEGPVPALDGFARALRDEAPRLARVDAVEVADIAVCGVGGFRIEASRTVAGEYQPIAADAATCDACVAELFDPSDRRYRYPFVNCTGCGPRFTIIEDVPYDRPLTTMRAFTMCAACRREYDDPADRRFHAQPNACPTCGPRLRFALADGVARPGDALALAVGALQRGAIVAVKGLGGFQLACDARSRSAVQELRARKRRPAKPLAVMVRDLDAARALCHVSDAEAGVLAGAVRPIVLLRRRQDADAAALAEGIAPGLHELGLMLPSTPLHHLLLAEAGAPLVMTSGNAGDEPIAKDDSEALARLGRIADAFLLHDRDIHARYDDSVVRVVDGEVHVVRRARGYCPVPVDVHSGGAEQVQVLALGAHLKNTFCILRDGRAFVGPHIGDLDTPEALRHQAESLATCVRLFRARPDTVAGDLHPDYASTALAERWWDEGTRPERVQHHHAHIASVMAEHGLRGALIGVAFDGTGLGPDGTIWGGELLVCDERTYRRAGHLATVRQPGGDRCAREGWRMAIAYLAACGLPLDAPPPSVDASRWCLVARVAQSPAAPLSTSAGRLFDAVASLLGVAQESSFEAEAAMRLEAIAARAGDGLAPVDVAMSDDPLVIHTPALVRALLADRQRGRPVDELALLFHESLAHAVAAACRRIAAGTGLRRVAVSGGVFQNALLLRRTTALLHDADLDVWTNRQVPANDGGISLGQALVAASVP